MDSDITETSANVLTSTMGSVLSNSNETNENPPAVDSLPSSSSDASNVDLSVRKKLPDDPISSTSDMGDGQFDRNNDISLPLSAPGRKPMASRPNIDNEDDLFANECNLSHITTEKITENVEDIVSDLENLLGNSTDDFPIRKGNSSILDPDLDDDLLFSDSSFNEKKTDKPSISDNLQGKNISLKNDTSGTISEMATGSVCQTSSRDIAETRKLEVFISVNKETVSEVILKDDLENLSAEKLNQKDLDETDKQSQTAFKDHLTSNKHLIRKDEERSNITTEVFETSKSDIVEQSILDKLILADVQMRSPGDIQLKGVTERDEVQAEVFQNDVEVQSNDDADTIACASMNVVIDKKSDEQEVYEAMETYQIKIESPEVSTCVEEVKKESLETIEVEDHDKTNKDLNKKEEIVEILETQSTEKTVEKHMEVEGEEGIQIGVMCEKVNIAEGIETDSEVESKNKFEFEVIPEAKNSKQTYEEKFVLDSGEENSEKIVTEQEGNIQDKNIEGMEIDKNETSTIQKVTEFNIDVKENKFVENTILLATDSNPESIVNTVESKDCETTFVESTTKVETLVSETSLYSDKVQNTELMEYETTETENFTIPEVEVEKTTKVGEKTVLNNTSDEALHSTDVLIKINSDLLRNKASAEEDMAKAVEEPVINEIDTNKNLDLMECLDIEIKSDNKQEHMDVEHKEDSINDVAILPKTSEAKIEQGHIESESSKNAVQEDESPDINDDEAIECKTIPDEVQQTDNIKDPDISLNDESAVIIEDNENFNTTEENVNEVPQCKEEMEVNLHVYKRDDDILGKEAVDSECSTSKIDDNAFTENMETDDINIKDIDQVNAEETAKIKDICIEQDLNNVLAERDTKNIVVEKAVENMAIGNEKTEEVSIQSENKRETAELVQINDFKEVNIKNEDTKMDRGIEEEMIDSLGAVKETLENIVSTAILEDISKSSGILDRTDATKICDKIQDDSTLLNPLETGNVGTETIECKVNEEGQIQKNVSFKVQETTMESESSVSKELTNTECDNLMESDSITSDSLDKIVTDSKNSILLPISETINEAVESAMKKATIKSLGWDDDIYDILPETTCEASNVIEQHNLVKDVNSETTNTCESKEINDNIPIENKDIVSEDVLDFKKDTSKLEIGISGNVIENITDSIDMGEGASQDKVINSSENIIQMEKNDIQKQNIDDETEENKSHELSKTNIPKSLEVSSTNNLQADKSITKPNEMVFEETAMQNEVQEEDETSTSSEIQNIKPVSPKLLENIPCDIKANEDVSEGKSQDIILTGNFVEDNNTIETKKMVQVQNTEVQIEKPQSNEDHMEVDINSDLIIETDEISKESNMKKTKIREESISNINEESQSADMTDEILDSVNSITENVSFDSQDHQEINTSQVDFDPETQTSENVGTSKTESVIENILENIESDNLNFNEPAAMEIDNEINDEDELVKAALEASTSASKDMEVATCSDQLNEQPEFSNDNDILKAAEDAINRDKQESEELALIQAALESQNRENDEQILIKAAADAQNNLVTEEAKKNAEKAAEAARKAAEAEREAAEKRATEVAAKRAAEAEKKAAEVAEKKAAVLTKKKAAEAAKKKAAETAERRAAEIAEKKAIKAAEKKAAEAAEKIAAEAAEKKAAEATEKKAAEAAEKKAAEASEKKAAEAAEKKATEVAEKKAAEAAEKKAAEAAEKKAAEAAEKKAAEAAVKKAAEAAEKKAAEAAQKKAVEAKKKTAEIAEKKAAEVADKKAAEAEKKTIEAEKFLLEINKAKNIEGYKMPLNIVVDTLPTTSISVIKEAESTTNEDTEICQKEVSSDEDKQAEYSSKISQNQELKLTIRKNKAEEPSSILKIYDPKNPNIIEISPSGSETEPEETPIPKLIIKQSQCSPKVLSPLKITIKPVMKAEEQTQKSSPKLIIKPIVKPEDEVKHIEEKHHSPKITIKPIIKPSDDSERCNSPKITIKPIIKPPEASTSPKIKIKPIVKPEEVKDESMIDEDETKERIVLKINKNNISHKEAKKTEEKETEKLAKIKLKFSKEGRHAHIVNEEMMEVEQKPSTKRHNPDDVEMEIKKQKLDVFSPEHIPKETLNPENINIPGPSQIEAIVIEDSLETSGPVIDLTPEPPPVVAPTPRRRGRPRKVPLEVREEFKDPKENIPEVVPVETATETASGRPKRSCRGPSVRTTLGIKPRKPRGAGRGRGGRGRGAAAAAEAVGAGVKSGRVEKEPKKEKITESKLKLLKEAAITAQVAESLENQDVEMKVEEIESISIVDVQEEKLRSLVNSKTVPEEPKLQPSDVVMYEEETRMSAETNSRAQTPAKQVVVAPDLVLIVEESQSSVQSTATTESIKARKNPRSEIALDPDGPVVSADQLAEYYWNGAGPYMLQEQVAQFLGIKSFKRKYPGIQRRPVDMQERDFIRESGLTSEHMCDLGLTAVNSADILDIMYSDFQNKYEEYCKYQRDRQTKDITNKQKALSLAASQEKNKLDIVQQAVESAAQWNVAFNKSRRDDRRACMDLQTYTINYPKGRVKHISKPKIGNYPIALVPGQYTDYFKTYTPTELNNLPLNTMLYHPINLHNEEDSHSDGSGSETDSSSSGSSSDSDSSEEDCNICTPPIGLKKAVV